MVSARGGWLYVATRANPGKPPSSPLLKLLLEDGIQQNNMKPGTHFDPRAAPVLGAPPN